MFLLSLCAAHVGFHQFTEDDSVDANFCIDRLLPFESKAKLINARLANSKYSSPYDNARRGPLSSWLVGVTDDDVMIDGTIKPLTGVKKKGEGDFRFEMSSPVGSGFNDAQNVDGDYTLTIKLSGESRLRLARFFKGGKADVPEFIEVEVVFFLDYEKRGLDSFKVWNNPPGFPNYGRVGFGDGFFTTASTDSGSGTNNSWEQLREAATQRQQVVVWGPLVFDTTVVGGKANIGHLELHPASSIRILP